MHAKRGVLRCVLSKILLPVISRNRQKKASITIEFSKTTGAFISMAERGGIQALIPVSPGIIDIFSSCVGVTVGKLRFSVR